MKPSKKIGAMNRIIEDLKIRWLNSNSIPVVYFTDVKNVGDLLNEYLLPKISGKNIVKVKTTMLPHLRAVGSVIGSSSPHSHVWGSGSIDGKTPSRKLDKKKIYALRGKKTRELISRSFNFELGQVPLGDPAILMPMFYYPRISPSDNIGIVPHFSDEKILEHYFNNKKIANVKIIRVGQHPEKFVSDILSCKYILSSSLHGLILADTYGIPNRWIRLSDKLLGGSYKFIDYYTTTDALVDDPMPMLEGGIFFQMIDRPDYFCRVNHYLYDPADLLESFPEKYMDFRDV
ncbi:polysaccharide pyruvyl transferase family protein [Halomonas sp. CKK8]|uniref:polysaccharide pyruvyl transferase family protein n=1 Tax=Halomonas sp. CKK8 TaxID=3036127 RepID=UPI0024155DED|nr:polysaccharide pyruvyl transferase family protein [Halomonas sp. CKK8]WFM69997.1 polysaccharide pyruvyl transferase family protein [Halomonas sp. CKK8]